VVEFKVLCLNDISEEELPAGGGSAFSRTYRGEHLLSEPREYWVDELCDSLMTLTQLKDHRNFYE